MATVAEQVQQIYIGLLGRAADQAGATFWEEQLSSGAITLDQMRANFVNEQPEYAEGLGSLSRADAVIELYNRLFERDPEADGAEYWTTGEGSTVPFDQLSITFFDAALGDDIIALENKTAAAEAYTQAAGSNYNAIAAANAVDSVDATAASLAASIETTNSLFAGDVITLTEGRDVATGSDLNDTIYADVGQNTLGAVSNALASGDIVDGGDGYDTLTATLINDSTVDSNDEEAPLPRLSNVEEIRLQALSDVTLDADHIDDEVAYASDSSRADLVIKNVDISDTQITKDIKLEMKDTQQFSDFEVYFNEQDLKAAPDVTVGSASVTLQVADGAQAVGTATPLINMTFDLSFTQDGNNFSFEDIESTDGTYAGLVTAIQVALAADGLTQYSVALDGEFTTFETSSAEIELNYTGFFITITDNDQNEFSAINFAPEQKEGSEVAILLAQSEVNAEETTSSFLVESDITVDNVGRGSNGGEIVIGSTSSSDSSTGVARINVTVENDSVIGDISSTNDALEHITLTNGTVKGDFVLANADFDAENDSDNVFGNVDQANLVKEGLTSIVATDFDGDIVLGRDANLVDLGTLSAAVNGDVTYNATLNDSNSYTATTGAGEDTIKITLDDNRADNDTDPDTSVTIATGAGNDKITVDEDNTTLEQTTATIDAGAGDDVVNGNDVAVSVVAGAGDDVVYAENTGTKALLSIATSGLYTAATAATISTAYSAGDLHFLEGREVTITVATNGVAADELVNGYESSKIEITASEGALTTVADLNAAILEAVNEDDVLSTIVTAYVDESNNVAFQYLVDGEQDVAAIELTVSDPTTATSVSAAMINEYQNLVNNSTLTAAQVLADYNAASLTTTTTTASAASHEGSTIQFTVAGTATTVTVNIGEDTFTFTPAGTVAGDATALANAFIANGYYAADDGTDTVSVVTDQEIIFSVTTGTLPTTVIANDQALTDTEIATLAGTDSVDTNNENKINGNSGDDVIVLSSDDTVADTVVWTDFNQGDDTIVHFVEGTDKLDFTSYLTGTVDANNSGSSSSSSEVALTNTAVSTLAFTANSINLVDFDALSGVSATQTFESLTTAQLAAALEAADASTALPTSSGDLNQDDGVSVLIIQDAANAAGTVTNDTLNAGSYKAYQVSYDNAAVAAGNAALDFSVTLIGSFDLGDDTTNVLATTDLVV